MNRVMILVVIVLLNNLQPLLADKYIIEHFSKYTNLIPSWWEEGDSVPKSWEDNIKHYKLDMKSFISEIKSSRFCKTYRYQGAKIQHIYNMDETSTCLILDNLEESVRSFSRTNIVKIIESSIPYYKPKLGLYDYIIVFKNIDYFSVLFIDIENRYIYYISKNGFYNGTY